MLDDPQLLRQLTSELAGEFGTRVIYEQIPVIENSVICCSCSWWLACNDLLPIPEQIIIALLPFPKLESPFVADRVECYKAQGRDWFREFLLPEMLLLLFCTLSVARRGKVRIAILDGRLRLRSWGTKVFRILEPWYPLQRLLPN